MQILWYHTVKPFLANQLLIIRTSNIRVFFPVLNSMRQNESFVDAVPGRAEPVIRGVGVILGALVRICIGG